jgi:hypothetical protein
MAEARPAPWKSIELRPYQEAALNAWNAASRRGVVVLPTGSGKTRLALSAMSTSGLRTLCLVPTRALLTQWHGVASQTYGGAVGCLGDGERRLSPITIATFESAYRYMHRIGNRFELLVVDEAHHFGGGLKDEALEMATAPSRLGLTATPPELRHHAARLSELIGPKVFELSVSDLAGSYLAPFDLVKLFVELTPEERRSYEGWLALYREPLAEFRRLHPGASWESFEGGGLLRRDGAPLPPGPARAVFSPTPRGNARSSALSWSGIGLPGSSSSWVITKRPTGSPGSSSSCRSPATSAGRSGPRSWGDSGAERCGHSSRRVY